MSFSLFGGLEAGKRALLSHQVSLTNIGHNITNVDTPGYSRQQVMLEATYPYESTEGKFGTGVTVATVRQIRDHFLSAQFRRENGSMGHWEAMDRSMRQIENVFLEPNENQLNDLLNDFFNAWHDLTTTPDSQTARSAIREQATLLIDGLRQTARRLNDIIRNLDDDVGGRVVKLNQMASQIADLNHQIANAELDGNTANDLRDKRDHIIDQLARHVDVNTIAEKTGASRVFIGQMEYVGTGHFQPLGTDLEATSNMSIQQIVWEGTHTRVNRFGGELQALINARDTIVPGYIEQLNELTAAIVTEVNALHTTGYGMNNRTGQNFFNPTGLTAETIELSQEVSADVANIAAAAHEDSPGDNEIALALANLRDQLVMENNTATFGDYYSSLVGTVGVQAQQAAESKDSFELVMQQIEFSRQSVQGVSLDEEMTNMIRAQHAFDAAARLVVTIDNAMGTVVNELGVGR